MTPNSIEEKAMRNKMSRCLAAAVAMSLMCGAVPSALAMTPDSGGAVSNYWNTGKTLKGWLDWRSALGWGTIGATNAIITAVSGASKGQMTRAALSGLCGTASAGVLATWTPKAEPTAASHFKAVVKAASVVGASSACGWITHFAFKAIDDRIGPAQNAINRMNARDFNDLKNTMADANGNMLGFEDILQKLTDAIARADSALQAYSDAHCTTQNRGAGFCKQQWDIYTSARAARADALDGLNNDGRNVAADLKHANELIKS